MFKYIMKNKSNQYEVEYSCDSFHLIFIDSSIEELSLTTER